ncbi:hypothetical protein [Bradyrhizobium sp. BWA-3-5]|uniref:hypothetical protein n=1 Tax=Bradyrhizobium sp. BWA-3-5 TaxID=3080013 RepID=UPI00293F2492|nr:hypothetical protein [Bradyrhizobium sp. BWA-3-5]WOH64085.1 hypothetical protein RX331_26220 [Bradyrhizobium sp. BWA-3-5]WOH64211.1 hypothetical protein RX331_27010 [Bradyrhizobium sp. BWA-3-5]WOH70134.1 hypothetical protein RX331_38155 [Bradyrhizobium sp. BWA-3-5]
MSSIVNPDRVAVTPAWRKPSLLVLGSVFLRNRAACNQLETLLTYRSIHAVICYFLARRLWTAGWRFPARLLSWFGGFLAHIDIHFGATMGRFFIDRGACRARRDCQSRESSMLYYDIPLGGVIVARASAILPRRTGNWSVTEQRSSVRSPSGSTRALGRHPVIIESTPSDITLVGIPARACGRSGAIAALSAISALTTI